MSVITSPSQYLGAAVASGSKPSARGRLIKAEGAVDAGRDHGLSGLEPHPLAVEADLNLVRLERDEARHRSDLGPRIQVGPRRVVRVANVVITAHALVGAEGLELHGGER